MIQFHLSKDAAKDLKHLLGAPEPVNYQAMQWYVHRVTIARRKVVVAMEKQSRYALVFCGLTKKELADFGQLFTYWFSINALACVVNKVGEDELLEQHVIEVASAIAAGQTYQEGYDRSVTAHIRQVVDLLRLFVERDGYPLPVEPRDTALFLMRANETLYRVGKAGEWFIPMEEFTRFWLELFEFVPELSLTPLTQPKPSVGVPRQSLGNVISVDFSARKKV